MTDLNFKPNTWYYCLPENFYFKIYIETVSDTAIDYRFVNKEENYYSRTRLHELKQLRFYEFKEVKDQKALELLYEPH